MYSINQIVCFFQFHPAVHADGLAVYFPGHDIYQRVVRDILASGDEWANSVSAAHSLSFFICTDNLWCYEPRYIVVKANVKYTYTFANKWELPCAKLRYVFSYLKFHIHLI